MVRNGRVCRGIRGAYQTSWKDGMKHAFWVFLTLTITLTAPVVADEWPSHRLVMTVTFPAGGPTDGVARVIAAELAKRIGQGIVVENRGGAGRHHRRDGSRQCPRGWILSPVHVQRVAQLLSDPV